MLPAMKRLLDSFWRAAAYCLHPRVIALSILPLVIMAAISLALGYFFWEGTVAAVQANLEGYELVNTVVGWLQRLGLSRLRIVLAPAVVLAVAIPVIVIVALLFVAWMMTPAMVDLVALRRFPALERKKGGSIFTSVLWSMGSTVLAAIALAISVPLWFIPPLILVLPPLIWGWLTYRVMSYDCLVAHASKAERLQIFKEHRANLLGIGVVSGYLGAAPSLLWASGAMFIAMAPVLVPVAIWMYTLVFAFSSLWFAHYVLSALQHIRSENRDYVPVVIEELAITNEAMTMPPKALPTLGEST